jgi:DNA-binding MarR family transcriptional regulator
VGKPSNDLDGSPVHLLHRAAQCAEMIYHAEVHLSGLTSRQLAVLMTVAQDEGLSQTAVVDRTGIDRTTVGEMLRRLQRKGLLQRRRTREDARAYAVKLTDEGRRVLHTAEPLAETVDERILEPLSGTRRAQFIGALQTIASILQRTSHKTVAKTA